MARRIPEDRLEQLVDCATQVFIEQGYARTQMTDVATALGVAKGTLYGYVESKEALFDLVLRKTLELPGDRLPDDLPVPHRTTSQTVSWLRRRLNFRNDFPLLESAATEPQGKLEPVAAGSSDSSRSTSTTACAGSSFVRFPMRPSSRDSSSRRSSSGPSTATGTRTHNPSTRRSRRLPSSAS